MSKDSSNGHKLQSAEASSGPTKSAEGPGFEPSTPVAIPHKIGHYRLKRVIASGGMGTVYEAVQENPRRTVAVKLIKPGVASRSALRRFEYESQILARLRHPGIAQVYEAGTHDDGTGAVPYFAMEYIPNAKPITVYAHEKKLAVPERLELFARVCDAVHHGHQKGVIHRDLKPGNILVDSQGDAKIIDFGVARGTDSDMAVTTLQTDIGQLIGTLSYMSPEQCEADPHDIDIRSDVYSLGIVLYELLTGQLPYDVSQRPVFEATRVIREQQPTRLSAVNTAMKGDPETIVSKALEKDREHRYQSAAELGQDVRHYLAGEAILARPPSILYQLRVVARRHTALLSALTAVFVVLAAGLITSSSLYLQADRARAEAADERDRAKTAEQRAEQRRAEAEAVTKFLADTLASVDPQASLGAEVTIKDMLDSASGEIDGAFPAQPLVEATLRSTIGNTYRALGKYAEAEPQLRAALEIRERELGDEHLDVAASWNDLGWLLREKGDFATAEQFHREALRVRRQTLGPQHADIAESLNNLANLLTARGGYGDYAAAESLHREALEMRRKLFGTEHPAVAESLNNLASLFYTKADYDAAEPLFREALALRRKLLGEDDPRVATALNNLAMLVKEKGDFAAAEPLFREALALRRKVLGNEHPAVATSLNNLALLLRAKGDYAAAEPLYREALALRRKTLGNEHPRVTPILQNLAGVLKAKGDYAAAERLYREALAIARKGFGPDHPNVATVLNNLAELLRVKGDFAAAEPLYLEALAIRRKRLDSDNPAIASVLGNLGSLRVAEGNYAEAEPLLREAVEIYRNARGGDDWRAAGTKGILGSCLTALGRYDNAEPLLLESYATIKSAKGERDDEVSRAVDRLVDLYTAWDAAQPGQGYAEKVEEWRAKLPAEDEESDGSPEGEEQEAQP